MTHELRVSKDVAFPRDTVTQTLVVYGGKGMGKTNLGAVLAEELARARLDLHPTGGSYSTNLGFLRSQGYLEGFRLTDKGQATARAQETGLEAALAALPDEPKRKIIRTLLDAGQPLSRDQLAERLGLHPTGGSYSTNLGRLRTMGLITARGPIAVSEGLLR